MKLKLDRAQDAAPIRITERDEAIMKLSYELGLLSVKAIALELDSTTQKALQTRITMLTKQRYLIYPPIQKEIFRNRTGKGSRPTVVQLGQRGAEYLHERFGYTVGTNWNDKARRRKGAVRAQSQFEHDVLANDTLIALMKAYRAREGFEVFTQTEIVERSPLATREMTGNPFSFPVRYLWPLDGEMYERSVIPDGVFAYQHEGKGEPETWLVFLEFDMKTEASARGVRGGKHSGQRTSIWQKIAMYNALGDSKYSNLLKQRFGIDRFQVMFVSKASPVQLGNMVEASAEFHRQCGLTPPKGRFFFTSHEQFLSFPNPLEKIWWNSAGGCRGFK